MVEGPGFCLGLRGGRPWRWERVGVCDNVKGVTLWGASGALPVQAAASLRGGWNSAGFYHETFRITHAGGAGQASGAGGGGFRGIPRHEKKRPGGYQGGGEGAGGKRTREGAPHNEKLFVLASRRGSPSRSAGRIRTAHASASRRWPLRRGGAPLCAGVTFLVHKTAPPAAARAAPGPGAGSPRRQLRVQGALPAEG